MKPMSGLSLFSAVNKLDSLIDNLLLLLTEKEKTVIVKRFNLDGRGRNTLDSIGKQYGVTRERVRQIEKNALGKMSRNVDNVGFSSIHSFMNDYVEKNGGCVTEKLLLNGLVSSVPVETNINSEHLHLAFVLNNSLKCVGNTVNFFPYVRRCNLSDSVLKTVSAKLIKELDSRKSVTKIDEIKNSLSANNINIKSLALIDKRIDVLEDSSLALMNWRHVRPRTLRDKILYVLKRVGKPVHFKKIASEIDALVFDKRVINVQAVHNELIRYDGFVLIGRGIYALAEWGFKSGTVSDVIVDVLTGVSEMSQDDIVQKVLDVRQVKKITVILALKNGIKFERVGRKFYRLVS